MCVLVAGGEGYRVTAQMVLVCCWRSMKEVSMLLGQLCQSLPLVCSTEEETRRPGLISEEQVRRRTLHTIHSFGFIYTKKKQKTVQPSMPHIDKLWPVAWKRSARFF